MKGIGGNIEGVFQIYESHKNEIGEAVKVWETIQSIKGFLDMSGGDSSYNAYYYKIQ